MKKLIAVLALCVLQSTVIAQNNQPINLIVAFPPGGPADRIARILADQLGKTLSRNVIVENKPGASSIIAVNYVMRTSDPNNTLFISSAGPLTINPAINKNLNYDPVTAFKPVSMVVNTTVVMVTGTPTEIKDAAEMVRKINTGDRGYSAASSGVGSTSHLSMEMFQESAGVNLMHIPYKGAAPAIADVVGKRVDIFFGDLPGVQGLIAGGKLKALAVAADKESPVLPGVRPLSEYGIKDVIPSGWYGVVMSSGADDEQVKAMSQAINKTLDKPEVAKQLLAMGAEPMPNSPRNFEEFLKEDRDRWSKLAKRRNISVSN